MKEPELHSPQLKRMERYMELCQSNPREAARVTVDLPACSARRLAAASPMRS